MVKDYESKIAYLNNLNEMLVMQFENLKKDKIENFLSQQKLQEATMKNGEKTTINNTLANINPNFSRISNDDQQNDNNEEMNESL